jgi:hypothetical protein
MMRAVSLLTMDLTTHSLTISYVFTRIISLIEFGKGIKLP